MRARLLEQILAAESLPPQIVGIGQSLVEQRFKADEPRFGGLPLNSGIDLLRPDTHLAIRLTDRLRGLLRHLGRPDGQSMRNEGPGQRSENAQLDRRSGRPLLQVRQSLGQRASLLVHFISSLFVFGDHKEPRPAESPKAQLGGAEGRP